MMRAERYMASLKQPTNRMKKIILTILSAFLLVACSQVNNTPTAKNTGTYSNEEFNISFQYPSNWQVVDKQVVKKLIDSKVISEEEKFDNAVILETGPNESIYFDYKSMSFDEYENYKQPKESEDEEIGGFIIEEISMANYPAKKYTEYGVELAGITYIVEISGKFLRFSTESGLTEEQKVGVEEILNSLKFE
jgi:hypothetical protein